MDSLEEMKKWMESLSVAEKRFIKLLGRARSGKSESQQLAYFDWLNRAESLEQFPTDAKFTHNLYTVTNRLKDLILDSLRLLNKEHDTDAILRTALDEMAILMQRKLFTALTRQLKRTKRLALERSRYGFALQCIQMEQEVARAQGGNHGLESLQNLRAEEIDILQRQNELHELRYRHDLMQARTSQMLVPRKSSELQDLREIAAPELVERLYATGNYLERILAANILGVSNWLEGNPMLAIHRYAALLTEWNAHPEWQNDQGAILFYTCHCFQATCFYSPLSVKEVEPYMALISDFRGLPSDLARNFRRMLYHSQFVFVLNLGQLDRLPALIAEIDGWLAQNTPPLTEARILPFLHNSLMAEFITSDHARAKLRIQSILNMPNRKVREDIREFALVLQAIIQYEMGEESLNEYLVRAGKRHFKKHSREQEFELAVFGYLEKALNTPHRDQLQPEIEKLIAQLDRLADQQPEAVPLLGLTEIRLWAKSKQLGLPLKEVFLEAVRENLEGLG